MIKTCMYFEKCNAPFHGYCWAEPGYIDECPVDCEKKEIDEDIPPACIPYEKRDTLTLQDLGV